MAFASLFPPNFTPISSTTQASKHLFSFNTCLPFSSLRYSNNKREFPLPSVASIPYQPVNVEYLVEEFSGHGVTFESLGDSSIAKIGLENGSTVTLMLPSGLITSYKAKMWHGGTTELLQTSVSEGEDGSAVVRGGVSMAFSFESEGETWSPTSWALRDIKGDSQDSIQVELISTDAKDMVEVKHIMRLKEDMLSSELVVSNSKSSSIQLTGSVISHLTVSTPEATYACGLEGSDFFSRPLFLSNLSIVPPDLGQNNGFGVGELLGNMGFKRFLPSWGKRNGQNGDEEKEMTGKEEEIEGEEDDNYKRLTEEMSRVYTSAPTYFTLIDRGRRNSVGIARDGFDELYMFSPGSKHEMYGMYSYICVGQSAMLKPVTLSPGDVWTGGQHLHNPNL